MDQNLPATTPPPSGEGPARLEQRMERLQAFTDSLIKKRKTAIEAREQSGIEQRWTEDEEFYDGIDDANREEMNWRKNTGLNGPITSERPVKSQRSTVFVNITQTYVDMAAAAIADMLLPTDDKPFGVNATPEPDLIEAKKSTEVLKVTGPDGQPMERPAGDVASDMLREAQESAKKAENRIWDWLTEGRWHTEVRSMIDEGAKIGTGVLKGPMPTTIKSKKIDRDPVTGDVKITVQTKVNPASTQISVRNLFPDPACGENIQRGSYIWEKDSISGRALRDLKDQIDPKDGTPYYMVEQIDKVLEEGPDKKYSTGNDKPDPSMVDADDYTIWYMHGLAEPADFEAAGCYCPDKQQVYPVHVVMVNDTPIKVTRSTLESGDFPYDVFIWQRVKGRWWGSGEARRVRTPQRGLNGGVRAMMNNAGLSSGPQIVINSDVIEPADNNPEITPLKLWRKKPGVEMADVQKAFWAFNIETRQPELLAIINFFVEMADKLATMPIQQQGQQGVTQETAEGRRILQNNAGVTKRRLAKIFDDRITEPHIGKYYEWLLLYGNDPTMKHDLVIDAVGSSVLFERDAQNIAVSQMGAYVKDPEYGLSPKRWMEEWAKSNKLDPKRFQLTDEEIEEMQKQPPPQDPRVQVAKIAADARLKVASVDTDRDTAYNESLAHRDQIAAEAAERADQRRYDLALLDYANKRGINIDKVKGILAKEAMGLRVQKELAHDDRVHEAKQVITPPMEPAGRAPRGKAFQK